VWATVNQLAAHEPNSITDGPFGSKLKTAHYTDTGPRVIRLQNIGDGIFNNEEAHISQEHFETLQRHQIFAGDVVIAALGATLPRACIIPEYVGPAIVKADCIRFRPQAELADARYLNAALNSDILKRIAAKIVHGIGRPRLNQQEIKSLPIPLPPLAEQQRIVAEVERRLSVVEGVAAAIEANLKRAERLRQAILKRAFAGRLVPQDPADEPASVVLARIRAAKSGGKRGRQLELPGV
jgi:type I restriction enzyme S subunit